MVAAVDQFGHDGNEESKVIYIYVCVYRYICIYQYINMNTHVYV